MHTFSFDDEELQCLRVCVANSPAPYNITKKKIPVSILDKIGHPKKVKHEGEILVKCDLSIYE